VKEGTEHFGLAVELSRVDTSTSAPAPAETEAPVEVIHKWWQTTFSYHSLTVSHSQLLALWLMSLRLYIGLMYSTLPVTDRLRANVFLLTNVDYSVIRAYMTE